MNRFERGQAILLVILIIGTIMAAVVIFGSKRQADTAITIERLDTSQTAQEVLSSAAKVVQRIYANESGCDPDKLDSRLSSLPNLPAAATTSFGANTSYAVAQPSLAGGTAARENRCATGTTGCRQLGMPLENRVYIATLGYVNSGSGLPGGLDCPRDATIRISVTIGGNLYYQRFSLLNVCTFLSCPTPDQATLYSVTDNADDFPSSTNYFTSASVLADACTNGFVGARYFGSFITANTDPAYKQVSLEDMRWARRYLETGGGGLGETTYYNFLTGVSTTNGACTQATSNDQCAARSCFPAFDLNRDRTNNEVDLAILESFLKGYIPMLPASMLDPRY